MEGKNNFRIVKVVKNLLWLKITFTNLPIEIFSLRVLTNNNVCWTLTLAAGFEQPLLSLY
jgi:hypothetical protein